MTTPAGAEVGSGVGPGVATTSVADGARLGALVVDNSGAPEPGVAAGEGLWATHADAASVTASPKPHGRMRRAYARQEIEDFVELFGDLTKDEERALARPSSRDYRCAPTGSSAFSGASPSCRKSVPTS